MLLCTCLGVLLIFLVMGVGTSTLTGTCSPAIAEMLRVAEGCRMCHVCLRRFEVKTTIFWSGWCQMTNSEAAAP